MPAKPPGAAICLHVPPQAPASSAGGVLPQQLVDGGQLDAQGKDFHGCAQILLRRISGGDTDIAVMRVIAVGDDDQNIYEFRGSDSKHMRALIEDFGAVQYEMTENYRSGGNIVALANAFVHSIGERMKTEDIRAVRQDSGTVQIVRHTSRHLEQPVVEHVLQTCGGGRACVLTNTNEEDFLPLWRSV